MLVRQLPILFILLKLRCTFTGFDWERINGNVVWIKWKCISASKYGGFWKKQLGSCVKGLLCTCHSKESGIDFINKNNHGWPYGSDKYLWRDLQSRRVISGVYTIFFWGMRQWRHFAVFELPRDKGNSTLPQVQTVSQCTVCTNFFKIRNMDLHFSICICCFPLASPFLWYAVAW